MTEPLTIEIDCLMLLDECGAEPDEIDTFWTEATLAEITLDN